MNVSRRQLFRFWDMVEPEPEGAVWQGESKRAPKTGAGMKARILHYSCLASTGCATCVERCPEPGAMTMSAGLPSVVADACTGCGICADMCPAPGKAIVLGPQTPA